jgi:hypothetical protein
VKDEVERRARCFADRCRDGRRGKIYFVEIAGEMLVRQEHQVRARCPRDMNERQISTRHIERVRNPFRIENNIADGRRGHAPFCVPACAFCKRL